MAKHVFEHRGYGWLDHLGEFISETDKTVTAKGSFTRPRRRNKVAGTKIVDTDRPEAIKAAFAAEWDKHKKAVQDAKNELWRLEEAQVRAAMDAAFGEGK